jgi:glycosyltransferase involved in cell wall biosynthesis
LKFFYKEALKSDLIILNIPNFEGLPLAIIGKILNKRIISIFHCQVHLEKNLINQLIEFFLNASVFLQLLLSDKIIGYKDYISSLSLGRLLKKKFMFCLPPIEKQKVGKNYLAKLLKEKGKNIWVGFSGRIAQQKGIEYLVSSTSGVLKSNRRLCIVFAGPYGNDVAGEIKYYQKIKKLLIKEKLKYLFFGNLTREKLGAFYKAIDVLVLPSINQTESFGMVQSEAMLLGTPVIATNLPGVRVPIKLTKMGIIVEPKNNRQISNAITNIVKNKQKYSNIKLIKNAEKIFNIKKVYRFYENLISF